LSGKRGGRPPIGDGPDDGIVHVRLGPLRVSVDVYAAEHTKGVQAKAIRELLEKGLRCTCDQLEKASPP
jgi:hypothetical protein